jgi:hypothetical protein
MKRDTGLPKVGTISSQVQTLKSNLVQLVQIAIASRKDTKLIVNYQQTPLLGK